jgi:hypothetical protein
MIVYVFQESSSHAGEQYLGPLPPPRRYIPYLRSFEGTPSELLAVSYHLDSLLPPSRFSRVAAREIRAALLDYLEIQEPPNA